MSAPVLLSVIKEKSVVAGALGSNHLWPEGRVISIVPLMGDFCSPGPAGIGSGFFF